MHGDATGLDEPPPILVRPLRLPAATLLALLLVGSGATAAPLCPDGPATIPLLPGTTWVYEGDVQSTVIKKDSGHLIKRHVTLRMEVREVFRRGNATAALVKGHPQELAWYEPGQPRRTYLVFQGADGTLTMAADDLDTRLRRWKDTGHVPEIAAEVEPSLRVGKIWGGDEYAAERPDKWYQWHVERARCVALRGVRGLDGRGLRREYRLGYWTCPEHLLVYWSPGLGITRFVYSHHGTVAEVDVRLVAFQPGPPDARVERIAVRPAAGARARRRAP